MGNLVADMDQINSLCSTLSDRTTEFDSILKSMISDIESIEGGWTGTDANNFIGNACNYLNNLSYVETALVDFINIVAKRNQGYADRITSFYDALK